jgi:ADP-ribosylation factor-like protein 1
MKEAFAKGGSQVEFHDYYKYRISYVSEKDQELIFLFVTGLTDVFDNIKKELIKCKKEFLNLFEDILQHKYDSKTFEVFDPTIDAIHRNLRPKISLVGFSGVGKTTITRLIKAEEIPMQHIPTITGDIATIKIGKLHFHLWDFAGQEQFSYLWNNFIKGSDAVLLITDSTLENVEKSKFFLELIKEQAPNAHSSVIANKQDLEDAMSPNQIEKILGLKTYSMIAKDENNRDKMITIIADILEMSAEVSPLLKPLLERDTLTEQATNALQNAEFEKAATYFEKISDLCIELGDDSLGREFYEKGKKIKDMLKKSKAPPLKIVEEQPKIEPEISESAAEEKETVKMEDMKEKLKEDRLKPPAMPQKPPIIAPKPPVVTKPAVATGDTKDLNKSIVQPFFKPTVKSIEAKTQSEVAAPPITELEKPIEEIGGFKKTEDEPSKPELKVAIVSEESQEKLRLDLKPEDFMVKQRPKTVANVPKDAKAKLKTSPFAHVSNPTESQIPKPVAPYQAFEKRDIKPPITPKINTTPPPIMKPRPVEISEIPKDKTLPPQPVSPTEIIKPQAKQTPISMPEVTPVQPIMPEPTSIPQEKHAEADSQQKENLEKSLMDLKIKRASVSKMALDFDMKELTGEITGAELEQKKKKLNEIETKIDQQIKELEKLLGI